MGLCSSLLMSMKKKSTADAPRTVLLASKVLAAWYQNSSKRHLAFVKKRRRNYVRTPMSVTQCCQLFIKIGNFWIPENGHYGSFEKFMTRLESHFFNKVGTTAIDSLSVCLGKSLIFSKSTVGIRVLNL